jgi:RNA polymerase sigma factor (sigma-70 family)
MAHRLRNLVEDDGGSPAQRVAPAAAVPDLSIDEWLQSPYLTRVATRAAHSIGLGPADIPDLLQEIRIALWRAGRRMGVRVGSVWLFQVASHKAVDILRRRIRSREIEQDFTTSTPAAQSPRLTELGHLLHARASRLPPPLREFYDLHYGHGWSEREIAARLGLCRQSVRWMDRICRRRLAGSVRPGTS